MSVKQKAFVFGSLEGIDVGTRTVTLFELRQTRIHASASTKHVTKNGVVSVIVGEKDSDTGELINMVSDIKIKSKRKGTSLKAAFTQNYIKGLPIRVVRCDKIGGQFCPLYGYRYDGLYEVGFVGEKTISEDRNRLYVHLHRLPNQPVPWDPPPVLIHLQPLPNIFRGEKHSERKAG